MAYLYLQAYQVLHEAQSLPVSKNRNRWLLVSLLDLVGILSLISSQVRMQWQNGRCP